MKFKLMSSLFVGLLATLFTTNAWGHSGNHTCSVSVQKSGEGAVYCSFTKNDKTKTSDSFTCKGGSSAESKNAYFYAEPADGWSFNGWYSDANHTGIISYEESYTKSSIACTSDPITYYALFVKQCTIRVKSSEHGKYTVAVGQDTIESTDGGTLSATTGNMVTLKATPDSGYTVKAWWYQEGNSEAVNLGNDFEYTLKLADDTMVWAEFTEKSFTVINKTKDGKKYMTVAAAVKDASANDILELIDNDEIAENTEIQTGVQFVVSVKKVLTVSANSTLTVSGKLFVDGTLKVLGSVGGNGTVSKCAKLITQTGKDGKRGADAEPFDSWPALGVVYWISKTETTTGTINVTGTCETSVLKHLTVINGRGVVVHSTPQATDLKLIRCCGVDSLVAMNHITSISESEYVDSATLHAANAAGNFKLLTMSGSFNGGSGNVKYAWKFGTTDCAGNALTINKELGGGSGFTLINGAITIAGSVQATDSYFINCSKVVASSYHSDTTKDQNFRFFDTTGINIKANMASGGDGAAFYSGKYDIDWGNVSNYKVFAYHDEAKDMTYSGAYKNNPKDVLADKTTFETKQRSEDGYWVVQKKPPAVKVAKADDGNEYVSIADAIKNCTEKVNLMAHVEIDEPIVIPVDKTVTIELDGYKLTGANGVFVNNGTLIINDGSNNDEPSYVTANAGNLFENNGVIEITCGTYSGKVVLNKGSNFITHGGTFNVTLEKGDGVESAAEVADIKGGIFSTDSKVAESKVTIPLLKTPVYGPKDDPNAKPQSIPSDCEYYIGDFLDEGYAAVPYDGKLYIGRNQYAICEEITIDGAEKAWRLTAIPKADQDVYSAYKNGSRQKRGDCADDAEWRHLQELITWIEPYSTRAIDCVLEFDRDIAASSLTAYVSFLPQTLDTAIPKNIPYSALIPRITQYQIQYQRFIYDSDWKELKCGVSNSSIDNIGTTCKISMYLTSEVRTINPGDGWRHAYFEYRPIAQASYKFTGKGAIWNGTDYDSLVKALTAANYRGTIKLSKDCEEEVEIDHLCEFTIDYNNFDASKLTFKLGNGLALKVENGVYTVGYANYTITYKDGESVLALSPTSYTMNDEVALPTITKDGNAFLGWKTPDSGEYQYLSKIAKGTTGNLTLTAYWKDVKDTEPVEMEIAKGTSDSGEAAEFKVEVDSDVVQKAADSGKSVVEVLNDKESNGLAKWENLALQQAGSYKTDIKPEASANTVEVKLTSEIPNVKSIGLAKVSENADGAKIAVENVKKETIASGDTATTLTVNFAELDTGVYQPTVFVEKDKVTVEIPDPNAKAVTVIKTESTEESVIVPVPGDLAIDGEPVSVEKVIDVSSLTEGDTIQAYNGKSYEAWEYNGKGGWTKLDVFGGTSGTVELKAGSAFWLTRGEKSDKSKPVKVIAQTAEDIKTSINEGWNLMANPKTEAVKISQISADVAKEGDTIVVPTKGLAQKTYTYKDGEWGYTKYGSKTVKIGDKEYKVATAERVEVGDDDDKIESGKGLWYVTEKANGKAINWSK